METTLRPIGPLERSMHVKVNAQEVRAEVDSEIKDLAKKLSLPGFRKGRVPINLIHERYGRDVLEDVRHKKYRNSLTEVLDSVRGMHISSVQSLENEDSGTVEYVFTFVEEPKLEVSSLENLKISRPIAEVTESDIESRLGLYRNLYKRFEERQESIKDGSVVFYRVKDLGSTRTVPETTEAGLEDSEFSISNDYRGTVGDDIRQLGPVCYFLQGEFEGKNQHDTFVVEKEVSLEDVREALKDALTRANPSESEESISEESIEVSEDEESRPESEVSSNIEVQIDEYIEETPSFNYWSKLHAQVTILRVGEYVLPELDEAFMALFGPDIKTRDDLNQFCTERIEQDIENTQHRVLADQILSQLVWMNPVRLPTEMITERINDARAQMESLSEEQRDDTFYESEPTQEQIEKTSEAILKNLVIAQYASENSVEVDMREMNQALMQEHQNATSIGQSTDYLHTKEYQRSLHNQLLESSVVKHICERVEIEDLCSSVDEILSSREIQVDLAEKKPEGGPYSWEPPVSEEEIQDGKREHELLLHPPEPEQEESAVEQPQTKKKGLLSRLMGIFGSKKHEKRD